MTVFVYLGPSLSKTDAEAVVEATVLPPIAMGDLYSLVRTRARPGDLVGIVDGLFEQVPAVWHKEILFAMQRGVRVFGASSMGALRAAELHPFGMIGVGRIFAAYRDGELEEDADVAVVHGPADSGFRVVSEALVNVREAVARARADRIVDERTAGITLDVAASQHYTERSWPLIGEAATARGADPAVIAAILAFVQRTQPNLKRDDAIALMRRLESERHAGPAKAAVPTFTFEHTSYWMGLTAQSALPGNDAGDSTRIASHVRATSSDRESLLLHARLLQLAARLRDTVGVSRVDATAAVERLCLRHGLSSQDALDDWCQHQHLSREEFTYLVTLDAWIYEMQRRERAFHDRHLLLSLKWTGRYAAEADVVRRKWQALADAGLSRPVLEDAGLSAERLQAWYEDRTGRPIGHVKHHLEELGFDSLREFLSELLSLYLLERSDADVVLRTAG